MPFKLSYYPDKLIDAAYKKSISELDKFFEFTWNRNQPKILIMDSRMTMDKYRGTPSPKWVVGWVENHNVCLLDGAKYVSDSIHKYSDTFFQTTIKHELVHCYTQILSQDIARPTWLWEGVAEYVSGGWKNHPIPKEFVDFLNYFNSHGDKKGNVYRESGYAVKVLTEKYGKKKLLNLIKNLKDGSTPPKFDVLFKKVYGFSPTYTKFNDILTK